MRLRACCVSLIFCDLDLCEVSELVLTVAATPEAQNARKTMKANNRPKPAQRLPEFNFLSPFPGVHPTM